MKSVIGALLVSMFGASAFACPGGHLKSLSVAGQVIAQVDMSTNRVVIVDSKSELLEIGLLAEGENVMQKICGSPGAVVEVCDHDQALGVELTSQPKSVLFIRVNINFHDEISFTATDFYRARGGCGTVVEPD